MSYFVIYCMLFICKLLRINHLDRGRELIHLLSLTSNYVVSVRRGFLFLWMLGIRWSISIGVPLYLHTDGDRSHRRMCRNLN